MRIEIETQLDTITIYHRRRCATAISAELIYSVFGGLNASTCLRRLLDVIRLRVAKMSADKQPDSGLLAGQRRRPAPDFRATLQLVSGRFPPGDETICQHSCGAFDLFICTGNGLFERSFIVSWQMMCIYLRSSDNLHCESKKHATILLSVTSPNVD